MKILTTADKDEDYPGTVELHPHYGMRGQRSSHPKVIRLVEVHGEEAAREQLRHYLSGEHLALDAEGAVARKLQASGYILPMAHGYHCPTDVPPTTFRGPLPLEEKK